MILKRELQLPVNFGSNGGTRLVQSSDVNLQLARLDPDENARIWP
jgi:hypothetical protein